MGEISFSGIKGILIEKTQAMEHILLRNRVAINRKRNIRRVTNFEIKPSVKGHMKWSILSI